MTEKICILLDDIQRLGLQLGESAARSFFHRGLVYLVGYQRLSDGQGRWAAAHNWCIEHAGSDNYSWAGDTFAFRDPEIATLFRLTWG